MRIDYCSQAGTCAQRVVEPWSVVVRHGRWYLLCRSRPSGECRVYRVDRVRRLALLDEVIEVPAQLDAVAALEEHLATGWEHEVEVAIAAAAQVAARCLPRTLGRVEPVDERSSILRGTTSNPFLVAEELARLPAAFTVQGCTHVRAAVRELGERFRAATS